MVFHVVEKDSLESMFRDFDFIVSSFICFLFQSCEEVDCSFFRSDLAVEEGHFCSQFGIFIKRCTFEV